LARPLAFGLPAAVTINSVNISQFDCSRFPQMCGYVEMRDSVGNPISHLTADSFCVYQDSTQINSFTLQELSLTGCRTSICLVVDVSGSMNDQNKIGAAKSAMRAFVRKMDTYDRVAIVKFSDCYTVVQNFTSDTTLLLSKINTLSANGYTAAFDGIWKGVDLTKTELGSKAVIAFSDGMENRSYWCGGSGTPDGLGDGFADDSALIVGLALGAGVPIHTISLGTDFDPQYLRKLAWGSNGTYYHAPTGAQIDSIYTTIKTRMCSQYLICYQSPDTVQNGDWHNLIICRQSPSLACGPCDTASCQEVAPPVIVRTPATINLETTCRHWQTATQICAWVTDKDTPQADLDVKLFYRSSPSSSYTSVSMTRTDSLYCYTIPADDIPCGADSIQYYITASDGRVTVASPALAPLNHHGFAVCPNHAPTVDAGTDQTIAQCAIAQICWATSAGDVDGNLQSVQLIEGPGTYNNNQICFTPTQTLDYEFVLRATDSCGLVSQDTVVIHYSCNRPPVANAGRDSTLFLCQAQQICWAAGCTDPDNNLQSCTLISGSGTYDGTSICFTPTTAGNYTFILRALDVCGASDLDTAVIHVSFNSAPVCIVPHDTSIFQCTPTQVCLPWSGSDVDGNLQSCTKISGPGSLVGNTWCYTPSGDETATVTIRCVDACGAFCESTFHVTFDVNQPPALSLGNDTAIFQCSAAEICLPYTVSDPDAGQSLTTTLISGSGTINPTTSTLCFTPTTAGAYTFIAQVQDPCGATRRDTLNVTVTFNHAPTASAGADQTVFQCSPGSICWPASCSDVDGNLSNCQLISAVGSYNGSQLCFTPTGSGDYQFVLQATDACGATGYDTAVVHVTENSAPQVVAQGDTSLFLCTAQSVCVSYVPGDVNGLTGLVEAMISGYGSIDTAANRMCFTPTAAGDYQFIVGVTDGCGLTDRDTVVAHISFGVSAEITCPSGTINKFLCGPDSIIQALTITPPGATVSVSNGIYADGAVRFKATAAGNYSIRVIASASCGADTCDLSFTVTFNHAPTASAGSDQTVFQCSPGSICWPASCSDVDGNLSNCQLISAVGSYNGSQLCFTPTGSGDYQFVLQATDACGATGYDTAVVHVTENSAPQVVAQGDTSLFLCTAQSVCVSYVPGDVNGLTGLVEAMISGYGSIDTAANRMCFTPTAAGDYQFIVGVTDGCGLTDRDTVVAHITFGEQAVINCPAEPIGVSLCAAAQVCQALTITPSGATVTTDFGTFSGGQLCFQADTTGTYTIRVIASASCGADTCDLVFNVDIGQAAQIDCPGTQSRFICAPQQVCVPLTVMTPEATFTVTPICSYSAGNVCFPADTSGHYVLKVKATTPCGSDSCQIVVDVDINTPPVASNPATPVDTFMCQTAQVCYQFAATDVDGGTLTWTKLSGVGSISASGLWCFNAVAGENGVAVKVADSCGAADTTTLTYAVTMNTSPVVAFGADTSIFLCTGSQYCVPYTATDVDNNVTLEQLLSPTGAVDTLNNRICFTPTTGGNYQFIVRGTDACGAYDQDTINVLVTLGTPVVVTCPADTAVFLCGPQEGCRPVSVSNPSATVTVTPQGTYNNGQVCFTPTAGGQYTFTVIATSACGADTCQFAVNVTMNANPVADNPPATVDTFLCAAAQICRQLTVTDPDGGTLTWSRISGAGTVSAGGLWCFTPTSAGTYSITAKVSDPCQAADTVVMAYVVTMNGAPTVTVGPNVQIFRCDQTPYCFPYQVADPNGNITLEELIAATGTIDTVANTVCFVPSGAGPYQFIVKATDACGAVGLDTMIVTVSVNHPPVANAGNDFTSFQCTATQVCFPIANTDPDGNLASCTLVQGTGTITCTQVCFTPPSAGLYTLIVRATDSCGAFDDDTVNVTITRNVAPVCSLPRDTTIFQCAPVQVQLPVSATDADGNFDRCELVHGSGSVAGGFWTHTPTATETDTVVVKCLDQCGAFCQDTFIVAFRIDRAPVADAGRDTSRFFCSPGQTLCWPASCSDPDGNLKSCALMSALGTYDPVHQEICFTVPSQEMSYGFILKAIDSCGREDLDTAWVRIDLNQPPTIDLPSNLDIFVDQPDSVCIGADITDVDGNLQSYAVTPIGEYLPGAGRICFVADTTGTYMLHVTATDSCGATAHDSVRVKVEIDECLHVQIQKTHNTLQGHYQPVDIYLNGSGKALGGFDLLIGYDQSVLTPVGVEPGPLFADCKWEYFTYRLGPFGNCGNACPSGMLRIIGLAETNNGAYHPTCDWQGQVGTFATMTFHVSNDRTYGCQYAPITFYWLDCSDNSFSSERGDTLWVSRRVFDLEGINITDYSFGFPGRFGAPDSCLAGGGIGKPAPERCIDFTNGGIDIVCPDSIDARGDINLNGVRNEVADAVMLTNYFITGLSVFGNHVEGSIAASDVNGDGTALSVADLVYLIRIIVGDAEPYAKPLPNSTFAVTSRQINGQTVVTYRSTDNAGAALLIFEVDGQVGEPAIGPGAASMDMQYRLAAGELRVLIYNIGEQSIAAGENTLVTIPVDGTIKLRDAEVADYDGRPMKTTIDVIPSTFALAQNYPNPFNPTTTLQFSLPVAADWTLTVYNVLGQVVERWKGHDQPGIIKVLWDASPYASGMYFYQLKAGDFVEAKKMVLLK
jgi:VWFA-related protein